MSASEAELSALAEIESVRAELREFLDPGVAAQNASYQPGFEYSLRDTHALVRRVLGLGSVSIAPLDTSSPLLKALPLVQQSGLVVDDCLASFQDHACLEAEARLITSLQRIGKPRGKDNNLPPTVVYNDSEGRPAAIQKTSGLKTIFTFRAATLPTQSGGRQVPANTLVLPYFRDASPVDEFRGTAKDLVVVGNHSKHLPAELFFLRFHNGIFSQAVWRALMANASIDLPVGSPPDACLLAQNHISRAVNTGTVERV